MANNLPNNEERRKLAELRSIDEVRKRLQIQRILGDDYKPKVKVRIAHAIPHFWNSIQTVAEAFSQNDELEVEIVLCSTNADERRQMKQQMEEGHYKYKYVEDYKIEVDKPEIVVFNIANTDVFFKMWGGGENIRRNAKYIAVIPYDNSVKFESADRMDRYYDSLIDLSPDIFIVAKPIYKIIKNKYANTIQMDSPKFDIIYRKMNHERNIPESWRKLNGKKIILWTTTHGHDEWCSDTFQVALSFDVYVRDVLAYFKAHQNVGLIFRPHPDYIHELVYTHKIWTEDDLYYIKNYFYHSDNMVWDDSADYSCAFAMSDCLITDDATGITLSYLPTRKPICILRRNKVEIYSGTLSVTENYYKSHDFSELQHFFGMVEQGEDPLYQKRMNTVEEYIPVFDGKNGMRIVDKILDDYGSK